jgi:serine/threonine-protein phosphatase 2A activator
MSVDAKEKEFRIPERAITAPFHLPQWKQSEGYHAIMAFIHKVNGAVRGHTCYDGSRLAAASPAVQRVEQLLQDALQLIEETPPVEQAMRFGNTAFRTWHDRMCELAALAMEEIVGEELAARGAGAEVGAYFVESFGNRQRIDCGTGHEFNFVIFLTCLYELGAVTDGDLESVCLDVFSRYLEVMRGLQKVYWLEPAGSKGAWGLDDYQFLSFYWGAGQLVGSQEVKVSDAIQDEVVAELEKKYMYMGCIKFITTVKTGLFSEHSAILYGIASKCDSWKKANTGLARMFDDEVINKFPIIQHVIFGSIIQIKPKIDPLSSAAPSSSAQRPLTNPNNPARAMPSRHTQLKIPAPKPK